MGSPKSSSSPCERTSGHEPWSGGAIVLLIQQVVEGNDRADELAQLHEVRGDDVYTAFTGSLRMDPLHHARQGPTRDSH